MRDTIAVAQQLLPTIRRTSPTLEVLDTPVLHSLQLQSDQKKRQDRPSLRRVHLVPTAEEPTSNLDTALTVRSGESRRQQKDMFINALAEDMTHQVTLRLPTTALTPEKQARVDQRQAVTSTAGSAAVAGFGDLISAVLRYVTNVVMTNLVSQSIFGAYATFYTSATVVGTIAV